jgi:histidine triad (HIT) family protein
MASVFTKIMRGELPGHFVWKDDRVVGLLSIAPLRPGHTLVVPREEVDHWIDLEPGLTRHLASVAQHIGKGIQAAFQPVKVGVSILGLEVPHVHLHVVPIWSPHDLDFDNADRDAKQEDLAAAAAKLRGELRRLGYDEASE